MSFKHLTHAWVKVDGFRWQNKRDPVPLARRAPPVWPFTIHLNQRDTMHHKRTCTARSKHLNDMCDQGLRQSQH